MKYTPSTTQATDVNGLRNWTTLELNRLSASLGAGDTASVEDLEAEIAARQAADTALAAQIEDLYVSTDGSNRTYAQPSAPTSPNIGDLWFDTDNNNVPARWSGTAWAPVDDLRIAANAAAIAAEITARAAADSTLTADVSSLANRATALEGTVNSATDGNLALKARVATEETTRATADGALATRATALESTVNNATSGVAATAARLTTEETARATADSALATRATALEATVNSGTDGNAALKARIASEETARASGDTAIASSVSSLTATVTNNFNTLDAAITDEETARADGDSAIASSVSSLTATVNGNYTALQARISTEEDARVSGDSALATRATALEATVNSSTDGNAALKARIASEETARASGDTAIASSVSALTATVTNNNNSINARVTAEETARADGDTAIASSVSALTATVTNNNTSINARVATEETARASGDSALASRATALEAVVNSSTDGNTVLKARIADEESARATNDSALAVRATALEATVNNATTGVAATAARIATEESARASGDSALATQITSVSTTVGANTASISTLQTSVNGLSARYGVTLNVNGYVTGFAQNNDGTSGSFDILADKFRVVVPGATPTQIFAVQAGEVAINGNLLVTGSVTSGSIAPNAVTSGATGYVETGINLTSSWQEVAACTLTMAGGSAKVDFCALINGKAEGSGSNIRVRLLRGSTVVRESILCNLPGENTVYTGTFNEYAVTTTYPISGSFPMFLVDNAGATGSTTYSIQLMADAINTVYASAAHRQIVVTEFRR